MTLPHTGLYLACVLCLLLSGCVHQKVEHKAFLWQQQEARFYDIPIMLHAKPDYAYHDQATGEISSQIAYTVEATYTDAQTYYTQQMERYGWRYLSVISGYEVTIIFEKPQKLCVISLRPAQQKNEIKIVILQGYK